MDKHGYAISAGAADETKVKQLCSSFWDFLEKFPPNNGVKRDDPHTWDGTGWLPSADNGIIFGNGFAHSKLMWDLRTLPKV